MFGEDEPDVEVEEKPRHHTITKQCFKNRLIQALEGLKGNQYGI